MRNKVVFSHFRRNEAGTLEDHRRQFFYTDDTLVPHEDTKDELVAQHSKIQ